MTGRYVEHAADPLWTTAHALSGRVATPTLADGLAPE